MMCGETIRVHGLIKMVLLTILMLTAFTDVTWAAWRLVTKQYQKLQVKYSIAADLYEPERGFYFPEYSVNDSVLYVGYRPVLREERGILYLLGLETSDSSSGPVWIWSKEFHQPLQCNAESTVLYQRILARNIASYSIYLLSDKDNTWYGKKFETEEEGYQIPTTESPTGWVAVGSGNSNDSMAFVTEGAPRNTIRRFVVVLEPHGDDFEFVVGNWEFYDRELVEREYYHPLFEGITGEQIHQRVTYDLFSRRQGDPRLLLDYGAYSLIGHEERMFYLQSEEEEDGKLLAMDLFRRVFDSYPYYEEHGLDKRDVLKRFEEICQRSKEFEEFIDNMWMLVEEFHDAHFYFADDRGQAETKPAPIYVYEIGDHLYVAAVFDTTLQKTVQIGDRVVAINEWSPEAMIDSMSLQYGGGPKLRRFKAVFQLLRRTRDDSLKISVISSATGDTIHPILKYDRRLEIPANFRPRSGEFKILEGNIAYFYMRSFDPNFWIRFMNYSNAIEQAKGLIFDLRGNAGGDDITLMRLLATFIDRPIILAHAYSPSRPDDWETIVVAPHPKFHFDLPVVILGDQRTACASEVFIHGMRQNTDAVLVSNSKTAGATSMSLPLFFREDFAIVLNTWTDYLLPPDNIRLEGHGLAPDIWVWIRKIEDLRPYEDKILKTAIHYLKGHDREQKVDNVGF